VAAFKSREGTPWGCRDEEKGTFSFRGLGTWGTLSQHPSLLQQPRSVSVSEPGAEVLSVVRPPSLEMCAHVGASCPESLPLLDDSPATGPLAPRDPPEPRVSTEHTNNRIGE
jgi:hypothetical protein